MPDVKRMLGCCFFFPATPIAFREVFFRMPEISQSQLGFCPFSLSPPPWAVQGDRGAQGDVGTLLQGVLSAAQCEPSISKKIKREGETRSFHL